MSARELIIFQRSGQIHPQIQVVDSLQCRYLRFGNHGGWQGALAFESSDRPVFPYQRAFMTVVETMPAPKSYLSIGVGTGTSLLSVQRQYKDCALYGVELDEAVIETAVQFFACPSHKEATYFVGDGTAFLAQASEQFDLIFVDAYMSNKIHSSFVDPGFPKQLSESLTHDGIGVCNIIMSLPPRGALAAFFQAAAEYFADILLLPVGTPFFEQNVLVVFSKQRGVMADWGRHIQKNAYLSLVQRCIWPARIQSGKVFPMV